MKQTFTIEDFKSRMTPKKAYARISMVRTYLTAAGTIKLNGSKRETSYFDLDKSIRDLRTVLVEHELMTISFNAIWELRELLIEMKGEK